MKQRKIIKIDDVIDLCETYLANEPLELTAEEVLQDMIVRLKELKETGEC